ncbi:MAG: TatD family hydrolase [Candidatus Cloacimonetes bacterium]|nr:TatD family hydrolase [Candidatus Cloacimonadota bacterium]
MRIFETHAHLDFPQFQKDREAIIKKCLGQGIEYIINVGVDRKTCLESIKLAEKFKTVYASVGFHPHDAKDFDADFIREQAQHPKVVAIGEIGLDYFRNLSPKQSQKRAFEEQIKIALDLNLPIIVHDRDAHQDCFDILADHEAKKVVFHCYSGDEVFALKVLEKNWFLSFTGIITYKNSHLENTVRIVPEEKFFIETDSPYLPPHPQRGKRNTPLNLPYIIEKISEIKMITPKKVAELSFRNACEFFNIKE